LDSWGTNHGVLINGAGFAPGVSGLGFRLDGANYVRVEDSTSLDLSNELTMQMWFKQDVGLPSGTGYTLLDKRTGSTANYGANMSQNYGFQLYYNDGNGFSISASPLPASGVWHHFAGTYRQRSNGVELITYIDGSAVRTNTLSGTLVAAVNNAPLSIGVAGQGSADFFRGVIDEIALYNYALTPSAVSSNYLNFAVSTTALIAPRFFLPERFRFQLDRMLPQSVIIEASTNLVDWNAIQITAITNPLGIFLVDSNAATSQRYYRLRQQ
jgi:hypothetical protein